MMENIQKLAEMFQDFDIRHLAELSPLEYDRIREAEAEKRGVRVSTLDKEVEKARCNKSPEQGIAALFPDIKTWPNAVNGSDLLNEIYTTIKNFIVCDNETAIAATLWIIFTLLPIFQPPQYSGLLKHTTQRF